MTLLAMIAIRSSAGLDSIGVGGFTAQAIHLGLLAVVFGALASGLGAATGQGRAGVFGASAGIGVLA